MRADRRLEKEIERLERWVHDLQSGMYVNCVYCGHRYGPKEDTPVAMAEILKQHIEKCPKHPMSRLKRLVRRMRQALADWEASPVNGSGHVHPSRGLVRRTARLLDVTERETR